MKRILFFAATASLLLSATQNSLYAQAKGASKAPATPFVVQTATIRRVISASGREQAHSESQFVIVWKSQARPKAIFYRPDPAHWLKCKATRSEKRPFGSGPSDFMVMEVKTNVQSLKPGDVVNLRPEEFPSDVQPDAVKSMPTGALFYQLENSNTWQAVKVRMKKLPDMREP